MRKLLEDTSSLEKLMIRTCWVQLYFRNLRRLAVERRMPEGHDEQRSASRAGDRIQRTPLLRKEEILDLAKGRQFAHGERELALKYWFKTEQRAWYSQEIKALEQEKALSVNSRLTGLTPFLDGEGLLRVRGRLDKAELSFDQKHPFLLPDGSRLAKLIVEGTHKATLHGGYQIMAVQIRERFWITRLKQLCRTVVSKCVRCTRYEERTVEQLMGSLPEARVTESKVFERTGVDYAGPFEIKPDLTRSKVRLKKYVAVFVCMSSKAVHLELVEDLTTQAFIRAFIRFAATQGKECKELWSDNGTTFVGAAKELGRMLKSWSQPGTVENEKLMAMAVKWNFITPRAPHQGGSGRLQ